MKKIDLVNIITKKSDINKNDVSQVINLFIEEINAALIDGHNVYLRGFGSFTLKKREKKVARNITKKESVIVPAHTVPSFKACKELKKNVSEKNPC